MCLQPGVSWISGICPMVCGDRQDVEAELKRICHHLSPLEIVVVNLGRDEIRRKRITSFPAAHGL